MSDDRQSRNAEPAMATPVSVPLLVVVALVLVSLLFGAWGLWRVFAPETDDLRAQLATSRHLAAGRSEQIEQLQQQVATLRRSDQISRDANRGLQGTMAERDEEIAALRADVAFYERLVGPTAQRRGLTVHAIRMLPQNDTAWRFATTLTQNLDRGTVSAGQLTLSIQGTRDGRARALDWGDLRQRPQAPGAAYSFKYFEQVEGDVFLPDGFSPVRVTVRLQPQSGSVVEESFAWDDVVDQAGGRAGVVDRLHDGSKPVPSQPSP